MSNIYFMIFMVVVSYFYMTFTRFLDYFNCFLLFVLFYRDYRVVGRVRAFFFELKHGINEARGVQNSVVLVSITKKKP